MWDHRTTLVDTFGNTFQRNKLDSGFACRSSVVVNSIGGQHPHKLIKHTRGLHGRPREIRWNRLKGHGHNQSLRIVLNVQLKAWRGSNCYRRHQDDGNGGYGHPHNDSPHGQLLVYTYSVADGASVPVRAIYDLCHPGFTFLHQSLPNLT